MPWTRSHPPHPLTATAKAQASWRYQPTHPGETIYKGHRSYELMRELQLGILYSVAQAGQQVARAGWQAPHYRAACVCSGGGGGGGVCVCWGWWGGRCGRLAW